MLKSVTVLGVTAVFTSLFVMKREIGRWTWRLKKLSVAVVERPRASRRNTSAVFVPCVPSATTGGRPPAIPTRSAAHPPAAAGSQGDQTPRRTDARRPAVDHADRVRAARVCVPVSGAGPAVASLACLQHLPEPPSVDDAVRLHDEHPIPACEPKPLDYAAQSLTVRNRMECVRRG